MLLELVLPGFDTLIINSRVNLTRKVNILYIHTCTYIFVYYTEWQNASAQDQNTSKQIRI